MVVRLTALLFLCSAASASSEADELQELQTALTRHLQKRTTNLEVQAFGSLLLAQIEARADAARMRSGSLASTAAADMPAIPLLSVLHLAQTNPDGGLVMPPTTQHVIIEIGCSDRDTADDLLLPNDPHAFLISFEPLLDKYSLLLGRGTARYHANKKDLSVPLGHHHPRGIVLPVAVSPAGAGFTSINVSRCARACAASYSSRTRSSHTDAPCIHPRALRPRLTTSWPTSLPPASCIALAPFPLACTQVRGLHVPCDGQPSQRLGGGVQAHARAAAHPHHLYRQRPASRRRPPYRKAQNRCAGAGSSYAVRSTTRERPVRICRTRDWTRLACEPSASHPLVFRRSLPSPPAVRVAMLRLSPRGHAEAIAPSELMDTFAGDGLAHHPGRAARAAGHGAAGGDGGALSALQAALRGAGDVQRGGGADGRVGL